ncbi:MAG: YdeI/OmpD-associated family protein [Bacteroidota bacterium]
MIKTENFEQVEVTAQEELREWLLAHHAQDDSVWLVTYKKVEPEKYVSTSQVLDELLCFGWIDGIRRKLDDKRTMQLISPRRVQYWSKTYKDRAARLEREGKMHAAGRRSIAESKENGMWHFLDDVDALIVPKDLAAGLKKHPGAEDFFMALPPAAKRFALRWIKLAKSDKTRANRIEKTSQLSAQGKKVPGS